MAAEATVNDQLFPPLRFGELDQEDSRGEVEDVRASQREEGVGEFVGDDFDVEGGESLFGRHCAGGNVAGIDQPSTLQSMLKVRYCLDADDVVN